MTLVDHARAAYERLPDGAQRQVRRVLDATHERRHRHDNGPFLERMSHAVGGFEGRRVIEIGADLAGSVVRAIEADHGAAEVVGLNPGYPPRQLTERTRLEAVDARATGFADESYDAIVSSSAFEHVHGLDEVLAEAHRVLRPGGSLFSHFGPIWSTSYGHHLWVQADSGRVLTYHDVILPSWCHLLRTGDEVRALLERDHDAALAAQMSEFVFDSPEQNQLFFDDYERIVADSPLDVVFLKGYDAPSLAARYLDAVEPELLEELHARHPGRRGFLYDGITLLLRKPPG